MSFLSSSSFPPPPPSSSSSSFATNFSTTTTTSASPHEAGEGGEPSYLAVSFLVLFSLVSVVFCSGLIFVCCCGACQWFREFRFFCNNQCEKIDFCGGCCQVCFRYDATNLDSPNAVKSNRNNSNNNNNDHSLKSFTNLGDRDRPEIEEALIAKQEKIVKQRRSASSSMSSNRTEATQFSDDSTHTVAAGRNPSTPTNGGFISSILNISNKNNNNDNNNDNNSNNTGVKTPTTPIITSPFAQPLLRKRSSSVTFVLPISEQQQQQQSDDLLGQPSAVSSSLSSMAQNAENSGTVNEGEYLIQL